MARKGHDAQHEAHLARARAALDELDAQIRLLQAKAEKQAADARIEYGNELEDLQGGLASAIASVRSALDRFR